MFADINRPLPMEGEELHEDGSPIKILSGVRQIAMGDIVQVEWPVFDDIGTGNWVKFTLTKIELEEPAAKYPSMLRVLKATLYGEAGWHMGAYDATFGQVNDQGEGGMILTPRIRVASIPWQWELRTDDQPGWHAFVVGHNCKVHDQGCAVGGRRLLFNDVRARSVRGSEKRE